MAGKVSSNGGALINFPSTTDERETPQGKVQEFFLLGNIKIIFLPFKRQFHKMVKHIETIRQQIADELFECV